MINFEELRNPSAKYRGMPFWAWNADLKPDKLEREIEAFHEMSYGGFTIHVRVGLKEPYFSEHFMDMVRLCVEKAKEDGMLVGLYDEDRWPSGYGSGIVTQNPAFRATHLLFTTTPYEQVQSTEIPFYLANFAVGVRTNLGSLLAVYDIVLDEKGYLKSYRLISPDAKATGTKWYAYIEENPSHSWYNGGAYVDVLNKDAIDSFISVTHERYAKEFGGEFGETIPSIFTDEPHMTFRTSFLSPMDTSDQFLPWTEKLPELCELKYGIDLIKNLPLLFWEGQEDQSIVRYYYGRILADLFAESYAKNIGDWCSEHHIQFTGHYLYEETLQTQSRSDGDLMKMYRYMDIPGMDLLNDEVDLTTAKQVQSVVRQYDKDGAMSEEYGVTNWAFEFRDYKFQSDWQAALGINRRVPHLCWMSMAGEAKRDFPASLFYQAPWYRQMSVLENHFARVNYLLSLGRPIVRVGMIHPIENYWIYSGTESQTGEFRSQLDEQFSSLTTWLLCGGIDFDYLSESLMPELYREENNCFGKEHYDAILIPSLDTIRSTTADILTRYEKMGGSLIFLGKRPQMIEGRSDPGLLDGVGEVISFSKYELLQRLASTREIDIVSRLDNVRDESYVYQMRELEEGKLVYIAAVKKSMVRDAVSLKQLSVSVNGSYYVYRIDTLHNEITQLDAKQTDCKTVAEVDLYENDSVMLFYSDSLLPEGLLKKEVPEFSIPVEVPSKVHCYREEQNIALLDQAEYALDDGTWQEKEELLRLDEILRERLSYSPRDFSMAQPYSREKDKRSHLLRLRFKIQSQCEIQDVFLALEEIEKTELVFNGESVKKEAVGWYIDEDIKKIYLGNIHQGENILELKIIYKDETNLENLYLLGDFSVTVQGESFTLERTKDIAWFGNIVGQGMDFYGGNLVYQFPISCPNGGFKIKIPKYRGACVGIFVDGKDTGERIISAPYEATIPELDPGEHTIGLILYGNRYNTLSHLHDYDEQDACNSFPTLWRTFSGKWTYNYELQPMGILVKPEVYV